MKRLLELLSAMYMLFEAARALIKLGKEDEWN